MPGSSKWSLSLRFLHLNPVCTSSLPYTCWSHAHLTVPDLISHLLFSENYKSFSSSLYTSLHYPVASPFLGPNILLRTLLWNTLSMCSSFNVRIQFSYQYKTIGKITVLSILISIVYGSKLEDNRFFTEWQQVFPDCSALWFYFWIEFSFFNVASKNLNSSTPSKELLEIFILWLLPAFWFRDMTIYLVLSGFNFTSIHLLKTT
jgi:hypothetical protein